MQDLEMLEKHFDDRYDHRYVAIQDCNEKQSKVADKFANDDKRIALISQDFSLIKKLMWAIATASIGSLVTAIFEIILK